MIPRHLQIAALVLLAVVFAMGLYVVQARRHAEQTETRASDQRPVPPPVAGASERVTLFVAYDEDGVLKRQPTSIALPPERAERARQVLRALLARYTETPSPHPIGAGGDIESVYLVSGNLAVVDFNAAFAAQHPSGVLAESLTLASLIQTLSANVGGITRVKFLVDGRERDTLAGHAGLRQLYDTTAVSQSVPIE